MNALMELPEAARQCMHALALAGFKAYVVGGCVRDALLGVMPHDFDLCTNATPEQMRQLFAAHTLVLAGVKHGTVGVVVDGEVVEITTFREEGSYTDNRHPDWVRFSESIEMDLCRRDFTINAMAWSPYHAFVDPFGGREDLKNHILRAVGDAHIRFQEDSLRILRGIRFAVRYSLTPETQTFRAMEDHRHLMDKLAAERVFSELCKLLPLITADGLLRYGRILSAVIPELEPMLGFDQHSPHHAYDLFTHTAHVTQAVPDDLTLRWAALLHDTGKIPTFTRDETGRGHFYGHAQESAKIAGEILRRLKAPTHLREQVVALIGLHMTKLEPSKKLLRRRLSQLGWEAVEKLLLLQEADMGSKGTGIPEEMEQFSQIRAILKEIRDEDACLSLKDLAVNGHDLMAMGYAGKAIGQCLNALLEQVLDGKLPNEKNALLHAAKSCL